MALAAVVITLSLAGEAAISDNKALLLYDTSEPRFKVEVELLKNILQAGGIPEAQIKIEPVTGATTPANIQGLANGAYLTDGNPDVKIFYYAGHSKKSDDANADEPEADPKKDEHMKNVRDDDLAPVWTNFNGNKLIVYNQCGAGGMFDGTSDPAPSDSFNIGSYKANVLGPGSEFQAAFAAALSGEADGADGSAKNKEITAKEIRAYLDSKLTGLKQPAYKVTNAAAENAVIVNVLAAPPPPPDVPDEGGNRCDPPAGVPTLSEWGLIFLTGVLAAIGMVAIRRRSR